MMWLKLAVKFVVTAHLTGIIVRGSVFNFDTCAYTFNVPAAECAAPPDSKLELLEAVVQNQQAQLQLLTERLLAIENPDPCPVDPGTDGGSGAGNNGVTYVRWGRTVCPDTAQRVYEGYAGKGYYEHGGGIDYQCLPTDPEFPVGASGGYQSQSYMYGVEYQDHGSPLWPVSLRHHDVPCAVCNVDGRTRQLMIPAKLTCPADWTMEYTGLLATQHHGHAASTFVCVDADMETVPGGEVDQNGGLLYVVEGVCGSLKCPPYIDGYELACVVCTL